METLNIYLGKKTFKTRIVLCAIMLLASILIIPSGFKIKASSDPYLIAGILLGLTIPRIIASKSHKRTTKAKKYLNFNKDLITHVVVCSLTYAVLVFTPFRLSIIGVLGVVFFDSILIYTIYNRKNPTLVLKEESFIDKSTMLSIGEIKYSQIKDTFIHTDMNIKQLVIVVDGLDENIKNLHLFKRLLNKNIKFVNIPSNSVDIALEEIEIMLKDRLNLNMAPKI